MLVGRVQISCLCGLSDQLFVHGVGFCKEKPMGTEEGGHVNPASVPLH